MCIETWLLIRHHVKQRAYRRIQPKTLFFYYSIWAWGLPAILILVSMAMDLSPTIPMTYVKPAFGSESCWFKCESFTTLVIIARLIVITNTHTKEAFHIFPQLYKIDVCTIWSNHHPMALTISSSWNIAIQTCHIFPFCLTSPFNIFREVGILIIIASSAADAEAMPYFYVPVGFLLLVNMILFIITAVRISRYQQELALRRLARNQHSDREDQRLFRRLKRIFIVCLVLFFLMGLNWMMELISWSVGGDPFDWTAFDLVNALQGVLIFGLFVLRRPIRDLVWHRIQKIRGIDTTELDVGSMDLALLPVINGDIPDRSFNHS